MYIVTSSRESRTKWPPTVRRSLAYYRVLLLRVYSVCSLRNVLDLGFRWTVVSGCFKSLVLSVVYILGRLGFFFSLQATPNFFFFRAKHFFFSSHKTDKKLEVVLYSFLTTSTFNPRNTIAMNPVTDRRILGRLVENTRRKSKYVNRIVTAC